MARKQDVLQGNQFKVRWLGPCVVKETINQAAYTLHVARDKSMILNFDMLKPFCGAEILLWVEQCRIRAVDKDGAAPPGAP